MRPICCGKRATKWRKEWKHSFPPEPKYNHVRASSLEAWRCQKCGRIGIPDGTFDRVASIAYHKEMDELRELCKKSDIA